MVKADSLSGGNNQRPIIYIYTASGQEQAAFKVNKNIVFSHLMSKINFVQKSNHMHCAFVCQIFCVFYCNIY